MHCYLLPEPTALERKIAKHAADGANPVMWKTFPDGEIFCRVGAVTDGTCVIGRTMAPADNFFRTALLIDTLRRAGASEVVAAIPYLGYSRQDRQIETGDAVTSHFVLDALAAAGAARIVTVDAHSESTVSACPVPVVDVNPIPEMALAIRVALGERFTVIAPDHGAKHRAERFAAELVSREPAWIEKQRDPKTGKVEIVNIHGDLQGDTAVIVDDIVDTGSTIALAVGALREKGFTTIHLCVTHPVFSAGAAALLRKLKLGRIVTTNTIDVSEAMSRVPGLRVIDLSRKIADAIRG